MECVLCSGTAELDLTLCSKCVADFSVSPHPGWSQASGQEFCHAAEVDKIAASLCNKYHPHLMGVDIQCVFLKNTPKSQDKLQFGRSSKVTGYAAWLKSGFSADPFFLIEISWETWVQLTPPQKVALVDHELEHLGVKQDGSMYIRGHDVEEFSSIVRRHGLWKEDVEQFLESAQEFQQNPLFADQ